MADIPLGARGYSGPAFFSFGFRPFFFCGALFAGLAIPVWMGLFSGHVIAPAAGFDPLRWHAHEMIFGYLGAILGGFLLTAIPNWTGRPPVAGTALAGLLALWLIARIAVGLQATGAVDPILVAVCALLYWPALAAIALREVAGAKAIHNLPVVAMIALFGVADFVSFLPDWADIDPMLGARLALGLITVLIALIGGRITPSFTRNWLIKERGGEGLLPSPFGLYDKVTVGLTAIAVLAWSFLPDDATVGAGLIAVALLQAVRLARWQGIRVLREPLLAILHLGYAWLALALFALGLSAVLPQVIATSQAIHLLTAGAIGTMTIGVMTRATLGHTGRNLAADTVTRIIYLLVTLGALLRVAAPWLATDYVETVATAGLLWAAAFLLYAAAYGRALFTPRIA